MEKITLTCFDETGKVGIQNATGWTVEQVVEFCKIQKLRGRTVGVKRSTGKKEIHYIPEERKLPVVWKPICKM